MRLLFRPGPVSAPMALTLARVAVLAPLGVALGVGWSSAALILFIAGALTDALDGFLARRMGCVTQAGAVADQIADKVFTSGTLILLAWAGAFPGPWIALPVALVAREFWVAGLRDWAARVGAPLSVGWIGKLKTLALMAGLGLLIAWPAHPLAGHAMLLVALALAIWSAARYTRRALAAAS